MTTMTPGRWINLVAAALGALGTMILFHWSFAFEGFFYWTTNELAKAQGECNRRRQIMQRIGLALILASFVVQGVAQLFD